MLSRRRVSLTIAFAAAGWLLAALLAAPAFADPPPGGGECPPNDLECKVHGGKPPKPGDPGNPPGGGKCYWGTTEMPCYQPNIGVYIGNGCYFKADPLYANLPPPPGFEGKKGVWGGRYCCNTPVCDVVFPVLFWMEDVPAAPPNPEEVAQQLLAEITLLPVKFEIAPDPNGAGLVGLPVWLSTRTVGPDIPPETTSTWNSITRGKTVPGLSVSITAKGSKIVWAMGDGNSVTCANPGTPYRIEYGAAHSPDCGYVYTKPSRGQSDGRYTITATTTFEVAWQGGGQSGVIVTTRTTQTSVRIDELQVVTE